MINEKVYHGKFGEGKIIEVAEGKVNILFPSDGERSFQSPQAFESGFLTFIDPQKQAAFLAELKDQREAEKKKREEEIEKQRAQPVKAPVQSSKRKLASPERADGEIRYFYVFQGTSYRSEMTGGYIWAPIKNEKGQTMHHWERMLDVQAGDVILHGFNGNVAAVSVAKGKAYPADNPHYTDEWDKTGRKVDLTSYQLRKPLPTKVFSEDIKRLSNEKYSPFDVNGSGNMGYLFAINPELVRVFSEAIVKDNPEVRQIQGINVLLKR